MSSVDLPTLLELARSAVGHAARRLHTHTIHQIMTKGDRDVVTDLDIAIERRTRDFLHRHTPAIGFLCEEEGGDSDASLQWILDPIDGTANFIRSLPLVGISLALTDGAQPLLGVIGLPLLNRTYWAAIGLGAWRNGQPIRPSSVHRLPEAMIAIGDYGTGREAAERNQVALAIHAALAPIAGKVRMLGSAAVDLTLVADGTLDASLTLGNLSWDMAAGVAIARAAGATVTDTDGSRHSMSSLTTIATAPRLAEPVLEIVRTAATGTRYAPARTRPC